MVICKECEAVIFIVQDDETSAIYSICKKCGTTYKLSKEKYKKELHYIDYKIIPTDSEFAFLRNLFEQLIELEDRINDSDDEFLIDKLLKRALVVEDDLKELMKIKKEG